MNRVRTARELAPPSPPCFDTRLQWLEYLGTAAELQRNGRHVGPLKFTAGQPVTFDFTLDYCEDCSADYARQRRSRGQCIPDWLEQFAPAPINHQEHLCPTSTTC